MLRVCYSEPDNCRPFGRSQVTASEGILSEDLEFYDQMAGHLEFLPAIWSTEADFQALFIVLQLLSVYFQWEFYFSMHLYIRREPHHLILLLLQSDHVDFFLLMQSLQE